MHIMAQTLGFLAIFRGRKLILWYKHQLSLNTQHTVSRHHTSCLLYALNSRHQTLLMKFAGLIVRPRLTSKHQTEARHYPNRNLFCVCYSLSLDVLAWTGAISIRHCLRRSSRLSCKYISSLIFALAYHAPLSSKSCDSC